MKELTAKQVEEVSGGNPVVVMLAVVAIRAAVPYIVKGVVLAAGAAAGAIGGIHGSGAAR